MKSSTITHLMSIVLIGLLLPGEGLCQGKDTMSGVKCTISIQNTDSGTEYKGEVESIVVNHEEQDWLALLNKTKELSFFSLNSKNKQLNRLLSEEEYFNIVIVKTGSDMFRLNKVKRTRNKKMNNGLNVTLKFKSVK